MGFLEIARTGRSETEVKNSRFLGRPAQCTPRKKRCSGLPD